MTVFADQAEQDFYCKPLFLYIFHEVNSGKSFFTLSSGSAIDAINNVNGSLEKNGIDKIPTDMMLYDHKSYIMIIGKENFVLGMEKSKIMWL